MPQVTAAIAAQHLGASHTKSVVIFELDRALAGRLAECRPTDQAGHGRLVLRIARE